MRHPDYRPEDWPQNGTIWESPVLKPNWDGRPVSDFRFWEGLTFTLLFSAALLALFFPRVVALFDWIKGVL